MQRSRVKGPAERGDRHVPPDILQEGDAFPRPGRPKPYKLIELHAYLEGHTLYLLLPLEHTPEPQTAPITTTITIIIRITNSQKQIHLRLRARRAATTALSVW